MRPSVQTRMIKLQAEWQKNTVGAVHWAGEFGDTFLHTNEWISRCAGYVELIHISFPLPVVYLGASFLPASLLGKLLCIFQYCLSVILSVKLSDCPTSLDRQNSILHNLECLDVSPLQ